jgi:CheY-like chemotaxis protein
MHNATIEASALGAPRFVSRSNSTRQPAAASGDRSTAPSAASSPEAVTQRRFVLVAEDDFLIGRATVSFLSSLGYTPLGPFATAGEALDAINQHDLAAAVLDISLLGGDCTPVADRLTEQRVPFLFLTGYTNPQRLPKRFNTAPRLNKPVNRDELRTHLRFLTDTRSDR